MIPAPRCGKLISAETAQALDREAAESWGLDPFALVEAAGRACARLFAGAFAPGEDPARGSRTLVVAGSGNNGADALVMLRALIMDGLIPAAAATALLTTTPALEERSPRAWALRGLVKMGVPALVWPDPACRQTLARADIILDGIAGTGLRGPLHGIPGELAAAINALKTVGEAPEAGEQGFFPLPRRSPLVVSVDLPSGNFEAWEPGMPLVEADMTLAIEPLKEVLYRPAARRFAGTILPVGGIFPPALTEACPGAELIRWDTVRDRIPRIQPDSHKYQRGVAEIRAGAPGFSGAARIAARAAQAAGAGLVRLVVDPGIYPILAVNAGGIMTAPAGEAGDEPGRFKADALLLGPGWGKAPDRSLLLERARAAEAQGVPLILDADAIALARGLRFRGNAILTPHAGEFAAYAGIGPEKALANPGPPLRELARERGLTILFKSHVLYVMDSAGRLGIADGMAPGLAAGGTGDLLAGFCVAIAARMARSAGGFDPYTCAAAAAALLTELSQNPACRRRFTDPLELADIAATMAGAAWL
jgi:NAD(P)H-hydrate epimerase